MSDLNWCTYCDNAIIITSNALYCSEDCLKLDALHRHPSLGYEYPEFQHFLKSDFNNNNNKQRQNNETSSRNNNTIFYQSTTSNQNLKSSTLLTLFIQSSNRHKIDQTSNMTNNNKLPSFYYKNTNTNT